MTGDTDVLGGNIWAVFSVSEVGFITKLAAAAATVLNGSPAVVTDGSGGRGSKFQTQFRYSWSVTSAGAADGGHG